MINANPVVWMSANGTMHPIIDVKITLVVTRTDVHELDTLQLASPVAYAHIECGVHGLVVAEAYARHACVATRLANTEQYSIAVGRQSFLPLPSVVLVFACELVSGRESNRRFVELFT